MKKYVLSFYLFFLTFIAMAQETGSITGKVIDNTNGEAIPNAEVLIIETNKGTVVSDSGKFTIDNVTPGVYTLKAHALGYSDQKLSNVKIEAGKSTYVKFLLKKENLKLDEVTISATKINKTIDKIGSPVYVIDAKEIERTEGRNVEEALLKIPGVFTEDRFHNETNIVSFRGVGLHTHVTSGILVLVDGVSLTTAMGRTDFEGVDLENAEKIEVLKGPVSALYGPNGITGVMNIIEKLPKEGFHGKAKISYGSYNTQTFSGDINGGKEGFRYLIKGKYFSTDGSLDYRNTSHSARGGVKLIKLLNKGGKIQFTTDYINSDMDLPGTFNREDFDNRETTPTNKNLFAGYEREFIRSNLVYTNKFSENSNLFANIYYLVNKSAGLYSDRGYSDNDMGSIGGEVRNQWKHELFGKKNSITVGLSLLREDGLSKYYDRDTHTGEIKNLKSDGESIYTLFGAYVEDEFNLSDKLSFTFGIRYDLVDYDWTDNFNVGEDNTSNSTNISSVNPKFGFAYNPTKNTTVFGNIARGFRPPTISQLFVGSSYGGIANPDLKPEYLNNYEIGIRGNVNKKLLYQASLFKMDFNDQISSEIIPEIDPNTPVYQNVGKTKHSGLETSLEYHFTKLFNIYANYSYLDARFNDDPEYGDNLMRKTPHNMFNSGLRYGFKFGLSVDLDYKFVDKYYMDNEEMMEYEGYSLVNLKFLYKKKGFMASFAINNLFDANYATYAYSSQKYNRITHQMEWVDKYIPGWPINFNTSISYHF